MGYGFTLPEQHKIPESKAKNATMHAIIFGRVIDKHAMHLINYEVPDHSSINIGTQVGYGCSDRKAGFDVDHLKTGKRFYDISGSGGDHPLSNFPIAGLCARSA